MLERKSMNMIKRLIKMLRYYVPKGFCCNSVAPSSCEVCRLIKKAKKLVKMLEI